MQFGKLTFEPAEDHLELLARLTQDQIRSTQLKDVLVSAIDPNLSDTAAFCEYYEVGPATAANCLVVEAKRGERVWYAACMVLATTKVDINNVVRRQLDARKISFASMESAVKLTGMEYGGITPIGLPNDWPIFVDAQVATTPYVIIGSGVRGSKLLVPGDLLGKLAGASVIDIVRH